METKEGPRRPVFSAVDWCSFGVHLFPTWAETEGEEETRAHEDV